MKPVVLLHDPIAGPAPHSGAIMATQSKLTVRGIPVACVGDSGPCFNHVAIAVEGSSKLTVSGRPVALPGAASCGGIVESTQSKLFAK